MLIFSILMKFIYFEKATRIWQNSPVDLYLTIVKRQNNWGFGFVILAESLYYVKYGSSIITSKILSKILSNENKKTGVSRKYVVCFGTFNSHLSWRQQEHQCLCFLYWDFFINFWSNNWRSIFDIVERLCYSYSLFRTHELLQQVSTEWNNEKRKITKQQ